MKTITILSALLVAASTALADGMPFPPWGYELYETDQIAVIDYDAETGTQEMHILPQFRGDTVDFAWVVPTPSIPELSESSDDLFRQFSLLSAPTYRYRDGFWGCGDNVIYADAGGIDIHISTTVGIYDALVLGADDAVALADSLTAWGYLHPDNTEEVVPILEAYVSEGWSFTAMRIREDALPEHDYWYGGVDPVAFTFTTDEMIYPMRLSAPGADLQSDVILYVITDHRTTFDGARTDYANRITSAELAAIRNLYPSVGVRLEEGDFVTKLSRVFAPEDMDEDVMIVRAPNDDEFKQIHYSGVPMTLGLLVAIGIGLRLGRRHRS